MTAGFTVSLLNLLGRDRYGVVSLHIYYSSANIPFQILQTCTGREDLRTTSHDRSIGSLDMLTVLEGRTLPDVNHTQLRPHRTFPGQDGVQTS